VLTGEGGQVGRVSRALPEVRLLASGLGGGSPGPRGSGAVQGRAGVSRGVASAAGCNDALVRTPSFPAGRWSAVVAGDLAGGLVHR